MKRFLLTALLCPAVALAADWVQINDTSVVQELYDKDSVSLHKGEGKVMLKFVYHDKQAGQTVTLGKPFDSSLNQYYVDCYTRKYQVLGLELYDGKTLVGQFHADFDRDEFDETRPSLAITTVMNRICPDFATSAPAK